MSKRWLRGRKKDYYYKKAKSDEYRSRASFKLKQINKKFKIIIEKDHVLDLGAAPGGWTQLTHEIVGNDGFILSVDLAKIDSFQSNNVVTLQRDFTKNSTLNTIIKIISKPDVIISDASPDISGVWGIDHFRSIELCREVFKICNKILKPNGNLLIKVFQGELINEFINELKSQFKYAKTTKPKASRLRSAEVYIVCKGYKKLDI